MTASVTPHTLPRAPDDNQEHYPEMASRAQKLGSAILAVVFAFVVIATAILTLAGYRAWPEMGENKRLADFPNPASQSVLDVEFFDNISNWISDRHASKIPMVALHSLIKLFGFGSSLNSKTVIGMDGWYYYGFQTMRDEFTGARKLEDDETYLRSVLVYLDTLFNYGRQSERVVLFMVPPNKQNVYPEHYAAGPVFAGWPSTAGKLENWIHRYHPDVALDMIGPLLKAARERQIYYRLDTHWNYLGGKLAVDSIADLLENKQGMTLIPLDDYVEYTRTFDRGNFATLLGLPLTEETTAIRPKRSWTAIADEEAPVEYAKRHFEKPARSFNARTGIDPSAPRLLVLGDSFMVHMILYAAERFSRSLFLNPWGYANTPEARFPLDLIDDFDPDVIVIEAVERRIVPCKVTRQNKCANNLNGLLQDSLRQMRLAGKFAGGQPLPAGTILQPLSDGIRYKLTVMSDGQKLPAGQIAVARVTFPAGTSGTIGTSAQRLPLQLRAEQTKVTITPDMTEAYLVLFLGSKRESTLLVAGDGLDLQTLSFEVRSFDDITSANAFLAASGLGKGGG